MERPGISDFLIELAKILGGAVRNAVDFNDYRITILIERKIDQKQGIVVDSMTFEKKMSALEIEIISKKLKEIVNKLDKERI